MRTILIFLLKFYGLLSIVDGQSGADYPGTSYTLPPPSNPSNQLYGLPTGGHQVSITAPSQQQSLYAAQQQSYPSQAYTSQQYSEPQTGSQPFASVQVSSKYSVPSSQYAGPSIQSSSQYSGPPPVSQASQYSSPPQAPQSSAQYSGPPPASPAASQYSGPPPAISSQYSGPPPASSPASQYSGPPPKSSQYSPPSPNQYTAPASTGSQYTAPQPNSYSQVPPSPGIQQYSQPPQALAPFASADAQSNSILPNAADGLNSDNGLGQGTIVHKHVYVHVPPPEIPEQRTYKSSQTVAPLPEKHYKILFIKAPDPPTLDSQDIPPIPPQPEQKTLVYVLVKKPEAGQQVIIPTPSPTKPSKPEVYFIRYKTPSSTPSPAYGTPPSSNTGYRS